MGKCTFDEMQRFIMKSHCEEFIEAYKKAFYAAIAKGEPYPSYMEVDTELYKKAGLMYLQELQEELNLQKTAFLNNIGSSYEEEGEIDKAIIAYEECAAIGSEADHCYERLRILYRKRKDYENMKRIIRRYAEVYGYDESWVNEETERYMPKEDGSKKQIILPASSNPYFVQGQTLEEKFYCIVNSLPEFDFYTKVEYGNRDIIPFETSVKLRELRTEINDKLEEAAKNERVGRLDLAARIYEELIGNGVHNTKPYERLYMIYKRAGLLNEAKTLLQSSIEFFSELRSTQYRQVHELAAKYNITHIKGVPLDEYGKIQYYGGMFDLYNPYPIIEKWKEIL